jgi:predicted RNA-binding protein Jag
VYVLLIDRSEDDMLKAFLTRLSDRRRAAADKRAIEEQGMSPKERAFIHERFEDRQADLETEEHFGGQDPKRLLED